MLWLQVLGAVVNMAHGKENCLVGMEEAFCGNGIVEEDEQCDCGFADDCMEMCCFGRMTDPPDDYAQCTRRNNVVCR